ncbi:MAG TPA: DUF4835 family protein [Cyclobacteriaceae bacterium]|nr:DUF4835 family protein [Cyclobacteriaceae bacterium]HRJ83425.1 DUF4835 family protein [Cyclobacteriaceae bacterium]
MHKLAIIIFLWCSGAALQAQELNCIVTINVGPRVQTTDRSVFTDMKNAFQQFLNTRKWTNDNYLAHEKINCSILININDMPAIGIFSASVQVQAARPVYNTNYSSLTFNFADRDWEFDYLESQPLEFNDNMYTSNITSMLAFYAYTIIGMDYDTFSELGGTPYFQRALQVVNNAQSSNRPGWQSVGSIRNRYWLVENLINPQFADIRRNQYSYHRLGLDTFEKNPDQSREVILKGLKDIKKARDINPNAILVITFFDAKAKEIANIFSDGQLPIRKEAYDLMTTMDPTNRAGYEKIIKN